MKAILVLLAMVAMWGASAWTNSSIDPGREVLALERKAMDGWLKGDPDAQLAISDSQITYFHAVRDKRLDGLSAVRQLCEQYRGAYEILDPKVQLSGDMAVLSYQLVRRKGSTTSYWNSTQVYQRKSEGWRVIHSHWSAAKAGQS